jgi:energy-coupling factor transporter ATP-binding protein EcfA2
LGRARIPEIVDEPTRDDLAGDLEYLASSLETLPIADIPENDRLIARRDWIIRTIRYYLLPRMGEHTAPLIVVFAGPTGAGKSTLLNSVTGAAHTLAGPLRPTTKEPLVLSSETRAGEYLHIGGVVCDVVTGRAPILEELILVDTPDIDSTAVEHRAIAETMIDNADVVVYVSSALRYADLVPWEVLRRAHSRGVPVIQVMNRIRGSSGGALADYSSRLENEGLASDIVAVHEHHIRPGAQTIPTAAVQDLRDRLVSVVEARRAGAADVVRSVFDTTIEQTRHVIDDATALLDVTGFATSHVKNLLDVDLGRIGVRRENVKGAGLDLRPLADLGSRRFRTKGMIRRRLPSSVDVAHSLTLFDESVIAAVDADIRRQLHAGGLIHGEERKQVLSDTHLASRTAVTRWRSEIGALPAVESSNDPPLVSLLLGGCCFDMPDGRLEELVRLLAPAIDLSEFAPDVAARLVDRLVPVYAGAEHHVVWRMTVAALSRRSIDRVKASRWAVIARSSFANA